MVRAVKYHGFSLDPQALRIPLWPSLHLAFHSLWGRGVHRGSWEGRTGYSSQHPPTCFGPERN